MKSIKILGNIEITLGLLIVAYSSVLMIQSTIDPQSDLHGYALIFGLFGSGLGGLLSFAGLAIRQSLKLGLLAHLPVIAFFGVSYVVYFGVYA